MLPTGKKRTLSLYDDEEDEERQVVGEQKEQEAGSAKKLKEDEKAAITETGDFDKKNGDGEVKEAVRDEIEKEEKPRKSMLWGLGTRRGEREDMQDAHLAVDNYEFHCKGVKRSALFAIFDGHSGARAADFCKDQLPEILKKKLSNFDELTVLEKSLKKVFTESFKIIDDAFLNIARNSKPVYRDGTTATVILLLNDVIYVANLGDSRAVVGRVKPDVASSSNGDNEEKGKEKLTAIQLTVDHNPTAFEERTRIQKAGATVKDGRVNGIIEVSRSIGDGAYKSLGISCIPDMKRLTLTTNDRLLIVACDGLWKTFSNEEATKFALEKVAEFEKAELEPELGESREQAVWRCAAESLAADAVKRKCGDNVSVLLLPLKMMDEEKNTT